MMAMPCLGEGWRRGHGGAAEEKRAAGRGDEAAKDSSLLDGVSAKAPALMEAHQLTTKAARVGFDWQNVEQIFDKLHEEVDELKAAIEESNAGGGDDARAASDEAAQARVREELGDLLFVVTNIARHLKVEPEAALKLTNRKFRRRFRHIERGLAARGQSLDAATLDEMETLWLEAKSSDK